MIDTDALAAHLRRAFSFLAEVDPWVDEALGEGLDIARLAAFQQEVAVALPGAFVGLVDDAVADVVVESLVQPVFDLLPTVSGFTDSDLKRHGGALFSSSLTDLGEHFCEHNERQLGAALEVAASGGTEQDVAAALEGVTTDMRGLISTLQETPCRLVAAEALYEAAGVGWMLSVLERMGDDEAVAEEMLAAFAREWTDEQGES